MLAQNFKTAADLGIEDVELEALIKVLGMLEREEIPFGPVLKWPKYSTDEQPEFFNMILTRSFAECGTAACICGWARFVAGDDEILEFEKSPALDSLFMVDNSTEENQAIIRAGGMGEVRPHQAAVALRSYLTTGEANWAEALA